MLVYRGDNSTLYIDKISPIYSNEKLKEDEELSSPLNCDCFSSSGSICFDKILFDSNIVKSMNEQVNSVRPFIQSITIDEDHVVPRRSIFQIVIQRSKFSLENKTNFYPV